MKTKSLLLLGAAALLAACGTPVGSKEDAARAAYASQQAASSASSGAQMGSPLLGGLDVGMTMTVQGKSGSADVKMNVDVSGENTDASYEITFKGYSADGKNTFDGTMTYTTSVQAGGSGASVKVVQKGKITMGGEFDSSLEMDITQSVVTSASGVKVEMNGFVKADGTQYDYTNESFNFSVSGT